MKVHDWSQIRRQVFSEEKLAEIDKKVAEELSKMKSKDKEAVFRNAPDTGPAREAYEDLREWAAGEMTQELRREVRDKLNEVSRKHGVPRKEVAILLMRPPAGETRRELVDFLYSVLFD